MGILSPSEIFTKHGDKIIFKVSILSPFKKTSQWSSCPHQKYLQSMGTRYFSKFQSCPNSNNLSMGILSPSGIFTRHGDKIIFKVSILSPFKKHLNGDLVPIRNFYYAWGQDNFQNLYLVPNQKICKWGSYPHQKF